MKGTAVNKTAIVGSNRYSGSSFGQWTISGVPLAFATSSIGGAFILKCDYN